MGIHGTITLHLYKKFLSNCCLSDLKLLGMYFLHTQCPFWTFHLYQWACPFVSTWCITTFLCFNTISLHYFIVFLINVFWHSHLFCLKLHLFQITVLMIFFSLFSCFLFTVTTSFFCKTFWYSVLVGQRLYKMFNLAIYFKIS